MDWKEKFYSENLNRFDKLKNNNFADLDEFENLKSLEESLHKNNNISNSKYNNSRNNSPQVQQFQQNNKNNNKEKIKQCDTQEWVLFTPKSTPEPSAEPTQRVQLQLNTTI